MICFLLALVWQSCYQVLASGCQNLSLELSQIGESGWLLWLGSLGIAGSWLHTGSRVLLGNGCLNAIRAVATIFSYSKSCAFPCEFCLEGQSLIWRDAAKLPTSIFSLSEGRHHFSVGSAMLLTSSDKDTWCSLGCKLAMFSFRESIWDILEGHYGWLLPLPERAQFWPLKSWVLRLWRVTSWLLWSTDDWKCTPVW